LVETVSDNDRRRALSRSESSRENPLWAAIEGCRKNPLGVGKTRTNFPQALPEKKNFFLPGGGKYHRFLPN